MSNIRSVWRNSTCWASSHCFTVFITTIWNLWIGECRRQIALVIYCQTHDVIYFCFWSRTHLFCWFCCFYWLQNESFSGWTIGSKNKAQLSNAKSVRCGCADVLWKEGKCQKKTKTAVEAQNTAGIRGPPSEEDRKYCKVYSEGETNSSLTWCRYTMMCQWSFVTSQWDSFQKCVSRHTLEGKDNEEKT